MEKKTDRRTLYTKGVVKDAFIALIRNTPYDKINVTALCRDAEISRATFYLHFDNVDDVLDQVIDDALLFSDETSGTLLDMIWGFSTEDICNADTLRQNENLLPACQRIANSDRYHALFMDSLVSSHIIQRIWQHKRDSVVPVLMKRSGLSKDDAELLFRFMLYGTFAVNTSLGWKKDDRWFHTQNLLNRFINGGIKEI